MIKCNAEMMKNHTTLKVGGPAEIMVIPQTENELVDIFAQYLGKKKPVRILGNGSNILVADNGVRGCVIKNTQACRDLRIEGKKVYAGSSIYVQHLLRACVDNNLGGLEFLASVPATVGGVIYMNAGKGRGFEQETGMFVDAVKVFDGDVIRWIERDDCSFSYRRSAFHEHKNWLILGARFSLTTQPGSTGIEKIKERMRRAWDVQDRMYPNVGSIFKQSNWRVLKFLRGVRRGGAKFSSKTANWINNIGDARSDDVVFLIRLAQVLHRLAGKQVEMEIEVWS
jgi:UDP-N-acetylmuramate dehydrogenase